MVGPAALTSRLEVTKKGRPSTSFDMVVCNDFYPFHLVGNVVEGAPKLGKLPAYAKQVTGTN
jgi:phosphoketolase